jgi:molybdate transport system substrate-binding protein
VEKTAPHAQRLLALIRPAFFGLVLYIYKYIDLGMLRIPLIFFAMAVTCGQARSGELSIAAASDLVFCLEELNRDFSKAHPEIAVKLITGASGNLFAQISNGAPFDVFLSADMRYPLELIKAGLAEGKSLTLYAIGHLVVWTANEAIDISSGISSLAGQKIRKIAVANPEHAPYGRAAKAALEYFGVWNAVQEKLVFGENIAQAAQFVETGNADVGIVALSIVLAPSLSSKGHWVDVPDYAYPRLEQGLVVTRSGASNPASQLYVDFLGSAAARTIFNRFGFRLPQ